MPGRNLLAVSDRGQLARLARDIRALEDGRLIDEELRRQLAEVGAPTVRAVRASIRAIPSKGQSARAGRRSLRSEMARATESKVRTTRRPGVIVWVNPRRMPPGKSSLPAYMDGKPPFHRWRKPTFGHSPWRTQAPRPYFDRAVASVPERADRAGARVLDYIADRIAD